MFVVNIVVEMLEFEVGSLYYCILFLVVFVLFIFIFVFNIVVEFVC